MKLCPNAWLLPRGKKGTYTVHFKIPTHMRETLGREKTYTVDRSTRTTDLAKAQKIGVQIVAKLIEEVERDYTAIKAQGPRMTQHELIAAAKDLIEQAARGGSFNLSETSMAKLEAEGKLPYGVSYEKADEYGTASEILSTLLEEYFETHEETLSDLRHAKTAARMVNSRGQFLPLSVAAEKHYADMERRDVTASAVQYARNTVEDFSEFTGDPDVSEVTRKMAGDWIAEKLAPLSLAESTKVKRIGFLKSAWAYFKRTSMTESNPFEDMDALVRGSKRGHKKLVKRPWTQDELDTLKDLAADDPKYAVSVIRLHSGARVEEVCCLRVEDIDLKAGTMAIGHTDDGAKNPSSVRILPLHPVSRSIIEKLMETPTEDGRLFHLKRAGKDKTFSHNLNKNLGRWIRSNVSKDAALTSYTLRHTYAQVMRDLGVDKETIEWTTGHKDQSMLFSTYATGVGLERLKEAVDKLDFGF